MDNNQFGNLNGFDTVNSDKNEAVQPDKPEGFTPPERPAQTFSPQQSPAAQSYGTPFVSPYAGGTAQPPHGYTPYVQRPVSPAAASSAVPAPGVLPKRPEKQKKQRGFGSIVAAMLATAIIASGATGATVFTIMDQNGGQAAENKTTEVKTINVEGTANNVIEAVAEKAGPSVVGIVVSVTARTSLFGQESTASSEGSGVVFSADGYIITNYHVISAAVTYTGSKISVYLPSSADQAVSATLVGYDSPTDLAVLKIDKSGLVPIELGDSSALKVGETVVAIGNPGGLDFMGSVSAGIISGLNRKIVLEDIGEMSLLQTDASINPGNSGGALVNAKGQLIGINNCKMAVDGFDGMGFSIPVNTVRGTVQNIIENKDLPTPVIGIEISTRYNEQNLTMMGYPAGIVVASVTENGPADNAGIQKGDIITHLNETETKSLAAFNSAKNKFKVGEKVILSVYRSGQTHKIEVTLGS